MIALRAFFLLFVLCVRPSLANATADWTIAIYAGTDEEEVDHYFAPFLKDMVGGKIQIPAHVEILLENDPYKQKGVHRYVFTSGNWAEHRRLAEHDSASSAALSDFLGWVKQKRTGQRLLFLVAGHSWGWKGLIQDYTLPASRPNPGVKDTMLPIRLFTESIRRSGLGSDIIFLDSCILGNAEPIDEFHGLSPFLTVSQRETPYGGFPYAAFFDWIGKHKNAEPEDVAKILPEIYAKAYARGGSHAKEEKEYFPTSAVSLRMENWSAFRQEFSQLVNALHAADFRRFLQDNSAWYSAFADGDHNVDLGELLNRVRTSVLSHPLLDFLLEKRFAYPEAAARQASELIHIRVAQVARFRLGIEADELLRKGTEDDPEISVEAQLINKWQSLNQGLPLPENLVFQVQEEETGEAKRRTFWVSGAVANDIYFRPWMAGANKIQLELCDSREQCRQSSVQRKDFVSVSAFPASSIYLSEAHTFGAPFVRGIGISLHPEMDNNEIRAGDPLTGLRGPAYYRSLPWNQATGWADLVLGFTLSAPAGSETASAASSPK